MDKRKLEETSKKYPNITLVPYVGNLELNFGHPISFECSFWQCNPLNFFKQQMVSLQLESLWEDIWWVKDQINPQHPQFNSSHDFC